MATNRGRYMIYGRLSIHKTKYLEHTVTVVWLPICPILATLIHTILRPEYVFNIGKGWNGSGYKKFARWELCTKQKPFLWFCKWYVLLLQLITAQTPYCHKSVSSQVTFTKKKQLSSNKFATHGKQPILILTRSQPRAILWTDWLLKLRTRLFNKRDGPAMQTFLTNIFVYGCHPSH